MSADERKPEEMLGQPAVKQAPKQTVEDDLLGRPHVAEKSFAADSRASVGRSFTTETPEERFAELQRMTSSYLAADEERLLQKAFDFASEAHKGVCRKSGEPYIIHPVEVAIILADLRMDVETLIAALLHDTVEDTDVTDEIVTEEFGEHVDQLVDGVTKITRIEVDNLSDKQAATIRKMFVAMSRDIRVIVIKLADRLHNMRTLAALAEDRRIFKSRETLEIYAPIAHRLGINSIKWELEDLSFYYLEPNKYKQVARMVMESRSEREAYLAQVIDILRDEMERVSIQAQVMGRPKHLYSIYQKMTKKGKGFSEIYDLIAVRLIVKSVKDCYSALGAVHTLWHPMPGRFKDYIAMPKFNMYQSLHTTVIGPAGNPLEVQIRTEEMHRMDEYGVAAHWRYKEGAGKRGDEALDQQLAWLREAVDWQDETSDSREFLKDLKVDLAPNEVFVFTPNGDAKSLRAGSTPVDFAYSIHTEVGNHCVGAKVNNLIVPLTYELQTGDRVEILTQKSASPSRDWLNIVKTPSARSKIRQYFSKVSRGDDLQEGRDKLTREMRKHGLGISSAQSMRALKSVAELQGSRRHAGEHRHGPRERPARGEPPAEDPGGQGQRAGREQLAGGGRHVHRQDAPDAHHRAPAAPPRDPFQQRHRGEGRRRRAGAPVALLQPGAGRRDHRLRHARARRVGASRRLPQRRRLEEGPRTHNRRLLGKRAGAQHVVPGGGLGGGARPHEPAARGARRHIRHGREPALLEPDRASRRHGRDALLVPSVRHRPYRAALEEAPGGRRRVRGAPHAPRRGPAREEVEVGQGRGFSFPPCLMDVKKG